MEELIKEIEEYLDRDLLVISISSPRKKAEVVRYTIRPLLIKGDLLFQLASFTETQAFHENLDRGRLTESLGEILPFYRQLQLKSRTGSLQALISKKGKVTVRRQGPDLAGAGWEKAEKISLRLNHDRKKNHILQEGQPVPFLRDLGVMNEDGKVLRARYDKFRQINRFLEFIKDLLPSLPRDREIRILDFGCGKSYLTFAVYYYLHELMGLPVQITGLDLKKDVIKRCQLLAKNYGYEGLDFRLGAIEDFDGEGPVDLVITLHACDTATDYALYKAVSWGAGAILSVPCCQHELNQQFAASSFGPVADYGLLKERFCALATDGIRACLLEALGYESRILEFIEMEHTPKNVLIRAVKKGRPSRAKWEEAEAFCRQFHFEPTLKRLLEEERTAFL